MKRTRLILYSAILALLAVLYYLIIDALYADLGSTDSERTLVPHLIAMVNVPVNLVLALIRMLALKGVRERNRPFDVMHFIIPILIAIACFAIQLWIGIILSVLAEFLIVFEFIRGVTKTNSLLRRKAG